MRTVRSLFSLTPQVLLSETRSLLTARAANLADLLEHLAEIDARQLYVEAAYRSTTAFLVGELGMDADSADKKIQAARAVRRVPALLPAIADGRLHLRAILMLAVHIEPDNADELIAAAANRSVLEIRDMLVARTSTGESAPDLLAQVVANPESEPEPVPVISGNGQAVESVHATAAYAPITPPAPARRTIAFTVPAELADAYRDALALAPYDVAHDPVRAFAQMVTAWREKLEKRKFGSGRRTARPEPAVDGTMGCGSRYIPKHVRREVWQRDGGQCTYTSDAGRRCECRKQLQYDHIVPQALGGESTVPNLRLRCHAHNQLAAEKAFGAGFMKARRAAAREAREAARTVAAAKRVAEREAGCAVTEAERQSRDTIDARTRDVIAALRSLKFRPDEAKSAAASCAGGPEQTLEAHVRAALGSLAKARPQAPFAAA